MSMMDLIKEIEKIDVTKGYGDGYDKLDDGNYNVECLGFTFTDKVDNYLYTFKFKELVSGKMCPYFINLGAKTIKFAPKNIMLSLSYLAGTSQEMVDKLTTQLISNPQKVAEYINEQVMGKMGTIELKTNKNGYQQCRVLDPNDEVTKQINSDDFPF